MVLLGFVHSVASFLRITLFATPDYPWSPLGVWLGRIIALSLLLRTYIIPWVLARISRRFRIRSVSLRSVRGLYVRSGRFTIRVDRISFGWATGGEKGYKLSFEGFRLEIFKQVDPHPSFTIQRRSFFAHLDPRARILRTIFGLYSFVDPIVRPIVRTHVVTVLTVLIGYLQNLSQNITFEFTPATIAFCGPKQVQIVFTQVCFQACMSFERREGETGKEKEAHPTERLARVHPSYNVGAFGARVAGSFRRTLDRALEKIHGDDKLSLTLTDAEGTVVSRQEDTSAHLLSLPGSIYIDASAAFDPRNLALSKHSLSSSIEIDDIVINFKRLMTVLEQPAPQPAKIPEHIHVPRSPSISFSTLLPSPLLSPSMSPVFSPLRSSGLFSPLASPLRSGGLFSPPSSPFLETLRFPLRNQPRKRLEENVTNSSKLSFLKSIRLSLTSLRLTSDDELVGNDVLYVIAVKDIGFNVGLSDSTHEDHSQWIGSRVKSSNLDSDVYSSKLSWHRIIVERNLGQKTMTLLRINSVECQALATQWPAPWLTSVSFMSGDLNACFLGLSIKIGNVELNEWAEFLSQWPTGRGHPQPSKSSAGLLSRLPSVPRIACNIHCGEITARLIIPAASSSKTLTLQSDGFTASAESNFLSGMSLAYRKDGAHLADSMITPVHKQYNARFTQSPVFIRTAHAAEEQVDQAHLEERTLLSVETWETILHGSLIVHADEQTQQSTIDTSSIVADVFSWCDVIYFELWNSTVVDVVKSALTHLPPPKIHSAPAAPAPSPLTIMDRLPPGLAVTLSLPRVVAMIMSPDVNPDAVLGTYRGVAGRISNVRIQYTHVHPSHVYHFRDLPSRSQTRHKLRLPDEQISDAQSSARSSSLGQMSACFSITLKDVAVRAAVATEYAVDDPMMAERDSPAFSHERFLRITDVRSTAALSGKRESIALLVKDTCEVVIHVPHVQSSFQLANLYHILSAQQTFSVLKSSLPERHTTEVSVTPSTTLSLSIGIAVKSIQCYCHLPKQRVAFRIDSLTVKQTSKKLIARWHRALVWVPLPIQVNRWQDKTPERWQELISLYKWTISPTGSQRLMVEGETARLHIPFGYVMANLILDIGVTVKASRHIFQVMQHGNFFPMTAPSPEGPKQMPHIILQIGAMSVEAADEAFEAQLGLIWHAGLEAAKCRIDREAAFVTKVSRIRESQGAPRSLDSNADYEFSDRHSVTVEEARLRLDHVHIYDWVLRLRNDKEQRALVQAELLKQFPDPASLAKGIGTVPDIVKTLPIVNTPPLFRALFENVSVDLSPPSFPTEHVADFLHKQGGLPSETEFSLLLPFHLNLSLSALRINLRDYPLPLVDIPVSADPTIPTFEFDTDLVIAEEMGTESSLEWISCPIIEPHRDLHGSASFSLAVPKTIMPVKSYANPEIRVAASEMTSISWGVCYGPAIQDLMRIIDSLSSPPRDPSPAIGFWDKLRLIFHWTIKASFDGELRFFMKGLRDPYSTVGSGAGFVLVWPQNSRLLLGQPNEENELVQLISDSMLIAVPNLDLLIRPGTIFSCKMSKLKKVVAKFRSGIRFGIGCVLERACGPDCLACEGPAFHRRCRFFDFKPHHSVKLENKSSSSVAHSDGDTYAGFRSDFIHLSVSLTSSLQSGTSRLPSSIHLTPKIFAHFYSWVGLFEGVLSLPIRQGAYYPARTLSPKFARHIATLKYRISARQLFVMHGYMDDSRETWVDGVTPWIGVKGVIDELQVDMHQRDTETRILDPSGGGSKTTRKKPIYAAELVLKGLDMRTLLATFTELRKQSVSITSSGQRSNYRNRDDLQHNDIVSEWYDPDDFVEVGWVAMSDPQIHILPAVTCPRFTYFKRDLASSDVENESNSKFGTELTHQCVLGTEPSVPEVQASLAYARVKELKQASSDRSHRTKMINLLEEYIQRLRNVDEATVHDSGDYQMPFDTVSASEWAEFDNVYQIHCPKIFLDSAVRDIMMQYYYASRATRGLEYHMAARAVKFIRDQAEVALANVSSHANTAQAAAQALRKMLIGDSKTSDRLDTLASDSSSAFDPLKGWSDGVSLNKSHCCLLLKPQIILRNREMEEETCIGAAVQAKLQTFAVMDNANADDPVSGKVMSRSYTLLSGLQTFAPTKISLSNDGCLPLEVLIDFRCETSDFDRLVPQTDATFHYDKFNRLRLRNNVTSVGVVREHGADDRGHTQTSHLQDQTDLVRVHIPRFTVIASEQHFQTISNIVTKLLLFSDVANKTRLEKLETLLFTYDFTDLASAARVVVDVQNRLRNARETELLATTKLDMMSDEAKFELLNLRAHIMLLAEELGQLFDAIKLAQDRGDEQVDQKSALLLNASSQEISWNMLDGDRDLLAKLAVKDIDYYWLSRQDSVTVNNLAVGNLQAFDGSPDAQWAEILAKYDEHGGHPLSRRNLFLTANWSVLPPVGGITIYESFELSFHPMRLQIDAKVGTRIMEYMWPARRNRAPLLDEKPDNSASPDSGGPPTGRLSLESAPPALSPKSASSTSPLSLSPPPLRRLGVSRSFTDLRTAASEPPSALSLIPLHRTRSTEGLSTSREIARPKSSRGYGPQEGNKAGDAAEMRTRSSQKSFVLVRISSLNLLLSIQKEDSFVCRDAHIRTRDLEYRNQTWSFEELVHQFIPSDTSWKGWLKMAFQQPLVPVLPVAREIISKTKWLATKGGKALTGEEGTPEQAQTPSAHRTGRQERLMQAEFLATGDGNMLDPGPTDGLSRRRNRSRVKSLFSRGTSRSRKGEKDVNTESSEPIMK